MEYNQLSKRYILCDPPIYIEIPHDYRKIIFLEIIN